jgi:hypothetical protein
MSSAVQKKKKKKELSASVVRPSAVLKKVVE